MQYVTTPGTQGICPTGWHIPTREEFETLSNSVSGDGNALKKIGLNSTNNGAGTNTSGFSALFGGFRDQNAFWREGDNSFYSWISQETWTIVLILLIIAAWTTILVLFSSSTIKDFGLSVRCLKN